MDWYPWCEEAFDAARERDLPVFVSIGYSSCHWCHVMEHETFSNLEIAARMNLNFICIKVDREERPDLDSIYMKACQVLTGSGGWPLNLFLTHDKKPFFAATYIPPTSYTGIPGMDKIIPAIARLWQTKRDQILESAREITKVISGETQRLHSRLKEDEILKIALNSLKESFDRENGGFGSAPKFPSPHLMLFLMDSASILGDHEAGDIALATLAAIRRGGIFDQAGGGIHRYSTTQDWLVPHFEKMLYDQALYAYACAEACTASNDPIFKDAIENVFSYVCSDMLSYEGAFHSAEDADSEGIEGKYYLWTICDIEDIMSNREAQAAAAYFDIRDEGNYSEGISKDPEKPGFNILHIADKKSPVPPDAKMLEIIKKMKLARKRRPRPVKDSKIIAGWNGLMAAALARASLCKGLEQYLEQAENCLSFVMSKMKLPVNRLAHCHIGSLSTQEAFLDGYAFVIWGLLETYQASLKETYLEQALKLTDTVLKNFYDPEKNVLYLNSELSENLIFRPEDPYDNATPSGSSAMIMNLLLLHEINGSQEFKDIARALMKKQLETCEKAPASAANLLRAYLRSKHGFVKAAISGDSDETARFRKAFEDVAYPGIIYCRSKEYKPGIYLCGKRKCLPRVISAEELKSAIKELTKTK